jgi:hypothetical protein
MTSSIDGSGQVRLPLWGTADPICSLQVVLKMRLRADAEMWAFFIVIVAHATRRLEARTEAVI